VRNYGLNELLIFVAEGLWYALSVVRWKSMSTSKAFAEKVEEAEERFFHH